MKRILPIFFIFIMTGCASLLDPQKDIALVEDIVDDVVKDETGIPLNLRAQAPQK
jgi:hypothetical protein